MRIVNGTAPGYMKLRIPAGRGLAGGESAGLVPDVAAFDEEDDVLGDIGRVIADALEMP